MAVLRGLYREVEVDVEADPLFRFGAEAYGVFTRSPESCCTEEPSTSLEGARPYFTALERSVYLDSRCEVTVRVIMFFCSSLLEMFDCLR